MVVLINCNLSPKTALQLVDPRKVTGEHRKYYVLHLQRILQYDGFIQKLHVVLQMDAIRMQGFMTKKMGCHQIGCTIFIIFINFLRDFVLLTC